MNPHLRGVTIPSTLALSVGVALTLCPEPSLAQQGLRTMQVATLTGEVIDVNVPADIRPGDRITGSVVAPTDEEGKLSATLEGAVVEVEDTESSIGGRLFSFAVPAATAAIPLLIKDRSGRTIAETTVPVRPPAVEPDPTIDPADVPTLDHPTPEGYAPFDYGQPGRPVTVQGPFDGDGTNTQVLIGGQPTTLIAESPRSSFHEVPETVPSGTTTLVIDEGGVREEFPFQVVGVGLSADKTTLLRGETATVSVTVTGLGNLNLERDAFAVDLSNQSPGTVRFREEAGNTLTRAIPPGAVRDGTYRFDTGVIGIDVGSYALTATVTSATCTDCTEQYERCLARSDAAERRCYRDCDRAGAGTGCYIACSASARLRETECFAQYIGCVRKKLFGI